MEIDELEEEMKKNISAYLESANVVAFSIDNLCTVSELKEKAQLLSSKYDERLKEKVSFKTDIDHRHMFFKYNIYNISKMLYVLQTLHLIGYATRYLFVISINQL